MTAAGPAAPAASGLYQLKCTHTIAFPVSSAGGEAPAMAAHRQAFPTPRGDGKSDPKGGVARLPDVVARRLWCTHTKARRALSTLYHNRMVRVIVFSRLLGRKRRAGDAGHRQAALTLPKGAKSDPSGGHGGPSDVVARLS